MTTNKPEIRAFLMQQDGYEPYVSIGRDSNCSGVTHPLIRLADYEALQAECEKLRKDAEFGRSVLSKREPVGEVRFELGAPSSIYAELYSETLPSLAPGTKLYTTPQPAPDVSGLVEALTELCDEIDKHEIHSAISKTNISWFKRKARAALAQGQGEA